MATAFLANLEVLYSFVLAAQTGVLIVTSHVMITDQVCHMIDHVQFYSDKMSAGTSLQVRSVSEAIQVFSRIEQVGNKVWLASLYNSVCERFFYVIVSY